MTSGLKTSLPTQIQCDQPYHGSLTFTLRSYNIGEITQDETG